VKEKDRAWKDARKGDDPQSFAAFYRLVFGLSIPPHAYKWIEALYNARGRDRRNYCERKR
jgi:hypothetical protein